MIEEAGLDKSTLSGMRTHFSALERREIDRLRKVLRESEEENAALRSALESYGFLEDVRVEVPRSTRVVPRGKKRKAYQLHLSDTHSREIVSRGSTGGRNEHNAEIGRDRLSQVIDMAQREIKRDSRGCDPVHVTVWGGGDWMVNADLHYKMERCVDSEPLVEMEQIYAMLREELGRFYSDIPSDSASFVGSFSNHGRDSEKMLPGIEANRSYDTAIYRRLRSDLPAVDFKIAETNWTVEDIAGFRSLYTHGHVKKANVSRSATGIMVPRWKFISDQIMDYRLNSWAQGHHHTHSVLWANRFCHIQNGSLVGENPYSHSEGYPGEPPSQNLVIVDLDLGVVDRVVRLVPKV